MPSQEKSPILSLEKIPSEPMSTYVPTAVSDCIRDDAAKEDRTESYIIARVLKKHYEKRLKARTEKAAQQRRAA